MFQGFAESRSSPAELRFSPALVSPHRSSLHLLHFSTLGPNTSLTRCRPQQYSKGCQVGLSGLWSPLKANLVIDAYVMATATVVQTAHPIELEEGISSREESTSQQVEVSSERNAGQLQQPLDFATKAKLVCAGYSFFCAGVNDGSLGPIIPYLLKSYNIGTNFVSIVYDFYRSY